MIYIVKRHFLKPVGEGSAYAHQTRHGPIPNDDDTIADTEMHHAGMHAGSVIGAFTNETEAQLRCLEGIDACYDPDLRFKDGCDTWQCMWGDWYLGGHGRVPFYSIEVWEHRLVTVHRLDFDAWFKHKIIDGKWSADQVSNKIAEWKTALDSGIVPVELQKCFIEKFVLFQHRADSGDNSDDDEVPPPQPLFELSPELQALLGIARAATKHEIIERLLGYIVENELQDPADPRIIVADDGLKKLIMRPEDRLSRYGLMPRIAHHLTRTNIRDYDYVISDQLKTFTGLEEVSRFDAARFVFKYVQQNNLQDPDNHRLIVPDDKLRALLSDPDEPLTVWTLHKQIKHHFVVKRNN